MKCQKCFKIQYFKELLNNTKKYLLYLKLRENKLHIITLSIYFHVFSIVFLSMTILWFWTEDAGEATTADNLEKSCPTGPDMVDPWWQILLTFWKKIGSHFYFSFFFPKYFYQSFLPNNYFSFMNSFSVICSTWEIQNQGSFSESIKK